MIKITIEDSNDKTKKTYETEKYVLAMDKLVCGYANNIFRAFVSMKISEDCDIKTLTMVGRLMPLINMVGINCFIKLYKEVINEKDKADPLGNIDIDQALKEILNRGR